MNGFLNIFKPKDMTSSQVVGKIRYLLGKKIKVGHMGTLDPLASGVLPIAVGRATRLFDFLLQKKKTYIATFQFGILTDTLDNTGTIVQQTTILPSLEQINDVLPNFIGKQEQIPPQYSAKSVNGKRAYDLARNGQVVELKPCKIEIFDIRVIKQISIDTFEFSITCSAGTYIRSIGRDLAERLGSLGTMVDLVRIQSGYFTAEHAVELNNVDASQLLPMDCVLSDLPVLDITEIQLQTLLNGKKVNIPNRQNALYRVYCDNKLQCLCHIVDGVLEPSVWLR